MSDMSPNSQQQQYKNPNKPTPILEQEYVYMAGDGTGEFRIVTIALEVTEMTEIVTVRAQQNMNGEELGQVLASFEEDYLKTMQMTLNANHPVQLEYKGRKFKINFGPDRKVTGIAPLTPAGSAAEPK